MLRIYGPQVGHLIDRETELAICPRLARKGIGPRILGTFQNGRFEEFLHAKALTFDDMRVPETSMQIAKRMRELHDGMDLLKNEREAGPFVWQNWDKWLNRCERICLWLDHEMTKSSGASASADPNHWSNTGFVCGVKWPVFRQTIEKYRMWLEKQYGGIDEIKDRMVFAHNDVSCLLSYHRCIWMLNHNLHRLNTATFFAWNQRVNRHSYYQLISTSSSLSLTLSMPTQIFQEWSLQTIS